MKQATRIWPLALLCAAALLAACGGGGSSTAENGISNDIAQGYAADAATMPVSAANGLDSASGELQRALTQTASASGVAQRTHALAAGPATVTVACALGGTVSWTVSGGTPAQQLNGQFDAGEVYAVSYNACAVAEGSLVIDGSLSLAVTACDAGAADFMLQSAALQLGTAQGSYVLDGSARLQRSSVGLDGGGTQIDTRLSSSGLGLATSIGSRTAGYTLSALDWRVRRSYDASGALAARSHQGSLNLSASTTRRPNLTLQVASLGAITLGSDGWLAQGSVSVIAGDNKLGVDCRNGSVVITLDIGNDGKVERSWTLTRGAFQGAAG